MEKEKCQYCGKEITKVLDNWYHNKAGVWHSSRLKAEPLTKG